MNEHFEQLLKICYRFSSDGHYNSGGLGPNIISPLSYNVKSETLEYFEEKKSYPLSEL